VSETPPQLPPDLPLVVRLGLMQWRTLLQLLADGHHQLRVLGPLYGEIERQCNEQITIALRERPDA
jgi:hypothetical protein